MQQLVKGLSREWRRANTFNSFWQGERLSPLAWACYASFAAHGEKIILYSYNKTLEAPKGVALRDARKVLPQSRLFSALGSFSAFSDIFRYELLQETGGWWVDADVVCLKKSSHSPPSELFAWEDHLHVNCGQIRLTRNSPIARDAIKALNEMDMDRISWADPGPVMFTKVLSELNMLDKALPRHAFYPLHWLETYKLVLADKFTEIQRSISSSGYLHAWGSQFRQFGFDVWAHMPEKGSFLDLLYQKSEVYDKYSLSSPDWRAVYSAITAYLSQEYFRQFEQEPLKLDLSSVSLPQG